MLAHKTARRAGAVHRHVLQTREMSSLMDKIKEFFIFKPNGVPYETYPSKASVGKGYRYPAPADQGVNVNVPVADADHDPYNTQYYTRDTTRNMAPILVADTPEARILNLPSELPPHEGSAGNKNPAVLRYDPTGTRSAMSTTWGAMEAELDKHRPDHLPVSWHVAKGIDDLEFSKKCGIPPRPGKPASWSGMKYDGKW